MAFVVREASLSSAPEFPDVSFSKKAKGPLKVPLWSNLLIYMNESIVNRSCAISMRLQLHE